MRLLPILFLALCAGALTSCDSSSMDVSAQRVKEDDGERNKSKNPPKGAPWTKSFAEAHSKALLEGKPIFVYSTKTY